MLKRSFIGFAKPSLKYAALPDKLAAPDPVAPSGIVTLLLEDSPGPNGSSRLKKGVKVKTGQKLSLDEGSTKYVVSSVTGTVAGLSKFAGDYGRQFTAIEIQTASEEEFDDTFAALVKAPTLATVAGFLNNLPGAPAFERFTDNTKPIDTIVISGCEEDLLVATSRHTIETRMASIKKGIAILKTVTALDNILIAVPTDLIQGYGHIGCEVVAVGTDYPSGMAPFIANKILGRVIPAGQKPEDIGIAFIRAEAVAALGQAFETGQIPVFKTITLITKDGVRKMMSARLGTPCKDLLKQAHIILNDRDRLILGGPMTGSAVFSEEYPVCPDTDAIMIQDRYDVPYISDYPCINCGECIRICPTRVPVNMLVRFLEVGQYAEAADLYDLYACIDCGLCSFVCVAKIPIFQYIKLAKFELGQMTAPTADTAEAANE
jgi:electron transport complex protein RnfC